MTVPMIGVLLLSNMNIVSYRPCANPLRVARMHLRGVVWITDGPIGSKSNGYGLLMLIYVTVCTSKLDSQS